MTEKYFMKPNKKAVKMKSSFNRRAVTRVHVAVIAAIIIVAAIIIAYYATHPAPSPSPSPTPTPTSTTTPTPPPAPTPTPENVENVGGKYNVTISLGEKYSEVEYTDEDGNHSGVFLVEMRSGLDWIKVNTPENAIFLCWWDHGYMIKGYAERNIVVRNPSTEILNSVADPSWVTEFEPHERIFDVATAFATTDLTVMMQVIEKYDVTHIFVSHNDFWKAGWIFNAAELEWIDYLESQDSSFEFTDYGKQTMIARLLENRDTNFTLVYEDLEIKVYETAD